VCRCSGMCSDQEAARGRGSAGVAGESARGRVGLVPLGGTWAEGRGPVDTTGVGLAVGRAAVEMGSDCA
jgi:hypothetical protein